MTTARDLSARCVTETVRELFITANTVLPADVLAAQPWRQTDAYSPLPERASMVLVKGSRVAGLERVAEALIG